MIRLIFATLCCTALTSEVQAQFQTQSRIQSLSRGAPTAASRILQNSTLSPYLALTDLTGNGNDISQNYFSIVKPRLESRANQMRQQRSIDSIQRTVTAMRSAAGAGDRRGVRISGHPTRFGEYGRYYPALSRRR